ncbi:MAG TPA: amino acid permease [Gemmataceae bacterium]|nr:amino acid permease [Gemmataceae bacterium]
MSAPGPCKAAPPRQFGYWAGHFVVMASMIGAGILVTSGYTLQATGNPAALLGLWLVGGAMALCGAVTVAELATTLPEAGGDYLFVREGFGRGAGFVAGWATITLGFCGPTAVVALVAVTHLAAPFMEHFSAVLPAWASGHILPFSATVLIAIVTAAHCLGQRESGRFQVVVTLVKVALLLGLAVGGMAFGAGSWQHLRAGNWPTAGHWPVLATGLIYIGYAYSGWNGAAYLAGEIREPNKFLPRALVTGTLSVVLLYILVNVAYVYALDPVEMTKRSPEEVQKVAELAVHRLFGPTAAGLFAVLIGLSLVASVSAYVLTGPRVAFAMARDGCFPALAGVLHASRGIPIRATIAQGGVAILLVWSGSFLQLLDYTSVGLAAVSGLMIASVFPLRARRDLAHPYRVPLFPLPPLLYLGLVGWTITQQLTQPDRVLTTLLSLGTLLAGVPLAWLFLRRSKVQRIITADSMR